MWETVAQVSSIFSLLAFFAAAIAYELRRRLKSREAMVKAAEEEDRARFSVDTTNLTRYQRYDLAREVIRRRSERLRWGLTTFVTVFLISAVLAVYPSISLIRLSSMNNLAQTLEAEGDLPAARQLFEQVLEIRERVLGAEHPDTLISMSNLAAILYARGDLPAARQLFEQVLEIRERVLGAEHPDTLISMNNLALTLQAQGDLPASRQLHEEVLEIKERVLGAEHPSTLISMASLASVLWREGDLRGARHLEEQVLEARRQSLGWDHPDTTLAMWNLLLTLENLRDEAAIQSLLEDLCRIMHKEDAVLSASQRQIKGYLNGRCELDSD